MVAAALCAYQATDATFNWGGGPGARDDLYNSGQANLGFGDFAATGAATITCYVDGGGDGALVAIAFIIGALSPTITAQPVEQAGASGGTATFSVSATASAGSNSYQWQKQAPGAGSWSNVGTNSSSYTTGTLAAADNLSRVRVVITDSNGSVTSAEVFLVVTGIGDGGRGQELNAWTVNRGLTAPRAPHLLRQLTARETRAGNASVAAYSAWWGFPTSGGGTIVAAGIATAEAIGQPAVAPQIVAAGVATGEAIGAPGVAGQVAASGVVSAEAEGQPAVAAGIAAAGIASGEAIGQPVVGSAAASIDCSGAGIASAEAVGSAAVAAQVAATGIATAEASGQPAVGVQIAAAGLASAEAIGSPALTGQVAGAGVVSSEAVGTPAVAAAVSASGVASVEALGAAAVGAVIGSAGIASGEAVGQPAVGGTPANIDAAGIASAEAVGQPTIAAGVSVAGVPTVESFGVPTIATQIIVPGLISAEAIGAPSVTIASFALSAQHAAWLEALARLHGLIDPLTVTSTGRSDGVLVQTFSEVAGVVTVTPVSVPSGAPGASALTAEQADWLEALARVHGLIDPQTVGPAGRTDGTLVQTIVESPPGTVTVTRAP